jgi:hypothetical protein
MLIPLGSNDELPMDDRNFLVSEICGLLCKDDYDASMTLIGFTSVVSGRLFITVVYSIYIADDA